MDPHRKKIYGAAGASIIAAAVTARYVAKWRRRRLLGHASEERLVGGGQCFIGVDLADPTVEDPRPVDIAVLDLDLKCTFSSWIYREDGAGIIPDIALGRSFIMAIDGPQGLAGDKQAKARESERIVNAPGKCAYELPSEGSPYAGLISGSVALFYRLISSGSRFRLLGLDSNVQGEPNLMEVYPGGVWRTLTQTQLSSKRTSSGRQQRSGILRSLGLDIPQELTPSADQLDAALCAWIGYQFYVGAADAEGLPPSLDEEYGVIREGFVVRPSTDKIPIDIVAPV